MQRLFLLCFVVIVLLGLLIPVYTDEPGWKAQQFRYSAIYRSKYMLPQCPTAFEIPVPMLFWPTVWIGQKIDLLLYGNQGSMWRIKLVAIAIMLMLLIVFKKFYHTLTSKNEEVPWLSISPLALGLLPWLTSMNRGEQKILLVSTLLSAAMLKPLREFNLLILAIFLSGLMLFMIWLHPQSILLAPLILGIYIVQSQWHRSWFIVLLFVGVICLQSQSFWQERVKCPEDMRLELALASVVEIKTDPRVWRDRLFKALPYTHGEGPFGSIGFQPHLPSDWLAPIGQLSFWQKIVNQVVHFTSLMIVVIVSSLVILCFRKKVFPKDMKLLVLYWFGLAIFCLLLMPERAFYKSPMIVWPWVMLLAILYPHMKSRKSHYYYKFFAVVGIISMVAITFTFFSQFQATLKSKGYMPHQPLSFTPYVAQKTRIQLHEFFSECGFAQTGKARRVVMDALAAETLRTQVEHPIYFEFVTYWWLHKDSPIEMLKASGSEGAFGSCQAIKMIKGIEGLHQREDLCCTKFSDST
jgi:hypothetical protein